ncbi:hypothetical protein ACQX86_14975 [Staphylococcus aureus]|uniref:hypothetical protein n=1 Tax=Staphylococcus aureus TaxID=1280 RepID=UPI003D1AEF4E
MATRYAVQYGLTAGPAHVLTNIAAVTYRTTHDREAAEALAAWLNTPESMQQLHAEISAKPEYANAEQIRTSLAEVVEIPD